MQTEQLRYIAKSMFTGNIYKNYPWINANIFAKIFDASREFLNTDLGLKLVGVTEKDNVFFAGEDYFVTKIRITKELNVLFRISKMAVEIILNEVLGNSDTKFEFENLTELEAKILTGFNDFLYKGFSNCLIDSAKLSKKAKQSSDCHFTIFVKDSSDNTGKIIISVPMAALPEIPEQEIEEIFSIDDFPKTLVPVDIKVGTTKISLRDIKNIEVEDIVVLENSNINKMTIKLGEDSKVFKLSPDPSLIVSMDDNEEELEGGGYIMEENITQNMWDSIQVDISAEFEQVKIPLGDLRQISEGLVVDIGSVYENKIDLKVEDKIIASGELVIINDRYGVRIDKVVNPEAQTSNSAYEQRSQETEEIQEQHVEDEFNEDDFDYSNFEIDDENI